MNKQSKKNDIKAQKKEEIIISISNEENRINSLLKTNQNVIEKNLVNSVDQINENATLKIVTIILTTSNRF